MTPNPTRCTPDPHDVAACAANMCSYFDPSGRKALGGRKQLRADLTQPPDSGGCRCEKCRPHPFTDAEADEVLSHVTDRLAVLYCLGKIDLSGCDECEKCGGLRPHFRDSPSSTLGTLASGRCPHHGVLRLA